MNTGMFSRRTRRACALIGISLLLLTACKGRGNSEESAPMPAEKEAAAIEPAGSASIDRGSFSRAGNYDALPVRSAVSVVWSFQAGSGISSAPAVTENSLFFGTEDGYLYQLETATGKIVWRFQTGGPLRSTPAVMGRKIYTAGTDGILYCFESRTGEKLWSVSAGGEFYASPILDDGNVILTGYDGTVYAHEAETGTAVWKTGTDSFPVGSPALSGQHLFFTDTGGNIRAIETSSGNVFWTVHPGSDRLSEPAISAGVIFTGSTSGIVYAVSETDGRTLWVFEGDGTASSAPAIAGERVFIGTAGGTLYALDAHTGRPVWSVPALPGFVIAPSVAGSVVYAPSTDNLLYCFDRETGRLLWKTEAAFPLSVPPVPFGRQLFTSDSEGNLVVLGGSGEEPDVIPEPETEAGETPESGVTPKIAELVPPVASENVRPGDTGAGTETSGKGGRGTEQRIGAGHPEDILTGDGVNRRYELSGKGQLTLAFKPARDGVYEFYMSGQDTLPAILKLYDANNEELAGNLDNDRFEAAFTYKVSRTGSYELRAAPASSESEGGPFFLQVKLLRE